MIRPLGSDLSVSLPNEIDYVEMAIAARHLLRQTSKTTIPGTQEVMNCATAAAIILKAGGISIERHASLAPQHPHYSVAYRHGVRAAQLGPDGGWGTTLLFQPVCVGGAKPIMGRSLYVYQRIATAPGQAEGSDVAAPDLVGDHGFIEHVLPLWWEDETAIVFDVRSQSNRILPLESYLAEEQDLPQVKSYLAELATGI